MKRLLVVAEGQSEEAFVNTVLVPHLSAFNVFPIPTIVETRHLPGRPRDKGGLSSWIKAKKDIQRRVADSDAYTTTLFDLYGLPDDFPGVNLPKVKDLDGDVERLERAMATEIDSASFIPFLAVHEFETWVFADTEAVATHFGRAALKSKLDEIVGQFSSIEQINHGPETHPSKRLELLIADYKKRSDGPTIMKNVGVAVIRNRCAHFDKWLKRLEQLGSAGTTN